MFIIIIVIALKFISPLLFFWFPFHASWFNFILDTIDGDILMHFGLNPITYQLWDKAADYVTYIMMFLAGRKWKIGKLITALFIFRTIGQIIFFTTRQDIFFFVFPNFLEPLFMIYALFIFQTKSEEKAYTRYKKYLWIIWIFIVLYKMWNEYNVHVGHIDLSTKYFGINN